jgi:hypothetical protein
MRILAAALSIALGSGCAAFAGEPPTVSPNKPVASVTVAPSSVAADAAAARHAKRTACRKQAAEKKVIATERADFIKQCMLKR